MSEIKKDDYYLFLKLFEYNYAYEYSPISFIHMIKEYSDHLKKEILSNFINLNRDEKSAYLDWLKFDIEKLQKNVWSTKERLEKWYLKYNVPADFVFKVEYSSNKLYQFLQSDRPTFKETFEPDFNPDLESSMDDFYNYYYGQGIIDMLSFIEEQVNKLQASEHLLSTSQIINDNSSSNNSKLKEAYFNKFLKFYDNIELPAQSTVCYYHDIWASFFLNLKSEIQSNIIKIQKEDRILYLESIFNKIKSSTLDFGYLETDIKKWYAKYNITEQLLFGPNKQVNELYHIIRTWPPDFDQISLPNYNNDTEDIQNDFYNYIMLRNANEVSNFIQLQISIIEQPLSLEDKNIEPIQVESTKSDSGFCRSFEDFLEMTNILFKYKSDWSCSYFYYALNESFSNMEADILNLYSKVDKNDKQKFIDAHILKTQSVTKHHIGGTTGWAEAYLKDNGYTLDYVFNTLIFEPDTPLDTIPGCLRLSYDEFTSRVSDQDAFDLRPSFFHYLSEYYVKKVEDFFNSLSMQINSSIKTNISLSNHNTNTGITNEPSNRDITSMMIELTRTLHYLKMISKGLDVPLNEIKIFENIFEGGSVDLFDEETISIYEYHLMPEFSGSRDLLDLPPIHEFLFKLIYIQNEFIKIENYSYQNYCRINAIYGQWYNLRDVFNVLITDDWVEGYLEKCLKYKFSECNSYQRFINIYYRFDKMIRVLSINFWKNHDKEFKQFSSDTDSILPSTTIRNSISSTINNGFIKTDISTDNLKLIFHKLLKYIDTKETDINNFLQVFNKSEKDFSSFKPINWHGDKTKLFAFIFAVSSYTDDNNNKWVPNAILKSLPKYFLIKGKEFSSLSRPKKKDYIEITTFKNIIENITIMKQ